MSRTKKDKGPLVAIGVRLEKAQKNAGLTNVEIARALDISIQSYIAYKHGKTEMSYEKAMIFADLTHTNVLDYLTPDGKTALKNEKIESETTKNGVLLEYLQSLNLFVGVKVRENEYKEPGNDSDFETRFRIDNAFWNKKYCSYLEAKSNYEKTEIPEEKAHFRMIMAMYQRDLSQAMPPATLSAKEWADMKQDIDKSVMDIIARHIENHLKRFEAKKLQSAVKLIAFDVIKGYPVKPEKLKKVCDGLQGAINDFMQNF